jgi:hypothetical protein
MQQEDDVVEVHTQELHGSRALQSGVGNLDKAGTDAVHADSMGGLGSVVLVVAEFSFCALVQSGHLL